MEKSDLEYMGNLSATVLLKVSITYRIIIWLTILFFISFFLWAYFLKIDHLVRASGKVIPVSKTQIVQSLEGGIISKIYIKEGDYISKGEPLVKIDDTGSSSTFLESNLHIYDLKAKIQRLKAESKNKNFSYKSSKNRKYNQKLANEKQLHKQNIALLNQKIVIAKNRLLEKKDALKEEKAKKRGLKKRVLLIEKEVTMKRTLLKQKVGSSAELNLAEQKLSAMEQDLDVSIQTIQKLKTGIIKEQEEIKQIKLVFQQKSMEKLNQVKAELMRIKQINIAKKDIVSRALVRSPVDGVVNRIHVHTEGQVIKSAENIIEIIPLADKLIIEAKIRPSDIGFLKKEQEAIVRFGAYDFTIYGSLKGKLVNISADTIEDKLDHQHYYIAYIQTDKAYLGEKDKLNIIPGMLVTIDIVSGKRTLLQYIFKPILRAKQNFLSQR